MHGSDVTVRFPPRTMWYTKHEWGHERRMETVDWIGREAALWSPHAVLTVGASLPSVVGRHRRPGMEANGPRTAARCALVAAAVAISAPWAVFAADPPLVTITGGSADSGHNYTWSVTNRYTSPIVRITFPHYRATVFDVPDGWNGKCTHLLGSGSTDEPGTCTAELLAPESSIQRGTSELFTMRVWQSGTQRTRATVSIWFADGTQLDVPGVELPARESFGDRYVSLLGLGSIFLVWLMVRAVRGKKVTWQAPTAAPRLKTDGQGSVVG